MPTQLQLRRGTTAQTATFTGASGEVTVDTTQNVIVVHDNVTAGGWPAPTLAYTQAAFNTANNALANTTNTFFAGNVTIPGNLTVTGTTTTLNVNREIINTTEVVAGQLTANAGIVSTNTSTGSLVVLGGAGISGSLYANAVYPVNALSTANGGTGLSGSTPFTTYGVVYASSTSALATGGNLTYTGTKLTITGSTGTTALQVGLTNATNNPYLAISQSESGSYSKIDANGTTIPACNLVFATAGSEAMRLTSAGYLGIGTTNPTALLQVANNSSAFSLSIPNANELVNIIAAAPSSTQNYYISANAVQYYTSSATTNWTINLSFSPGTTINSALAVGQQVTVAMYATQGSTAYYNTTVQVDGATSGVTTYWQTGTAPTKGNASGIDVYTYTIIKTASSTYTVLATQTQF
jgi:hypothetical protein